jgi:asparagine synthase (glutamine-hydrolysing)
MPGFMGIISDKNTICAEDFDLYYPKIAVVKEETKRFPNSWFKRSIVDKFANDKVFFEDNDVFICSDGLILNGIELRNKHVSKNNFELLKKIYRNAPRSFPSELRGDFDGAIYDKNNETWILYTNHIGTKWIFYFFDEISKSLVFGTELKMVVSGMKALGFKPKLSEESAYFLLTFGYMLGDHTLIEGVKKLQPGSTMRLCNGKLSKDKYYILGNTPYLNDSETKAIRELDERFRFAIKAEYDKDLEYNYNHIATLSGGLDSRMNVCYAKKIGYANILNITFSQSNYLDELIAKNIASDWGYGFLFYSLDNGNYLKDIESPTIANDGLVLFSGSAHMLKMVSNVAWGDKGLLHTGQIGDLVLGSYLQTPEHNKVSEEIIIKTAYSSMLMSKNGEYFIKQLASYYDTDELFAFGERCVNGVFNGFRAIETFSEYASPFLHIDFLDYAMHLSPKLRYKERIYLDWILREAPEASRYPWEKTHLPINAGRFRNFMARGARFIRKKLLGPSSKDSMNPFDYWYKNNDQLRRYFDKYFQENLILLSSYPALQADTNLIYEIGTPLEKTQSLTLLAAMKLHGLEK